MGGLAGEDDAHAPGGTVHRPCRQRDLAQRDAWHVVIRECEVRLDLVKPRIVDDSGGAGSILLGRLEHQNRAATLRTLPSQTKRQGGQTRHVSVMPAEMRLSGRGGAMGEVGDLLDRQGVEFGPEQDRGARRRTFIHRRDAVPAKIGKDAVGMGGRKERADFARGFFLLPGQLGHAVELAPPCDQFGDVLVGQEHGNLRNAGMRDHRGAFRQPGTSAVWSARSSIP